MSLLPESGVASVRIGDAVFGDGSLGLIAGPCVAESLDLCLRVATQIRELTERLGMPFVFKSSFDKANRTSLRSQRAPGMDDGLALLAAVRERAGVPVLTDVHEPDQAAAAAYAVDALQIPAFLARQTDLILAAGATGKPVNLKKGQFMAPWEMEGPIEKLTSTGNTGILLTERGTSFGYSNLVVDFRSLPIMRAFGYPVVFDATHSLQQPGSLGNASGAQREFVPQLVRAAVACRVDALFLEVHPDPAAAWSDGPAQVPLESLEAILRDAMRIKRATSPL